MPEKELRIICAAIRNRCGQVAAGQIKYPTPQDNGKLYSEHLY